MSPVSERGPPAAGTTVPGRGRVKSTFRRPACSHATLKAAASVLLGLALLAALIAPAAAVAHGPVDPAASSYLARVTTVPAGIEAKAIDGDQRMWMRVAPGLNVVVLDYLPGIAYLRFSRSGVQVNQSSSMYYLNQIPAQTPPAGLTPATPPRWQSVSRGHEYGWHDGRLHALAATALAPGTTYAGRWTVPIRVDGRSTVIAGGLFYAPNPSLAWFWPIVVALACVPAALRLRREAMDLRLGRALAVIALAAFVIAGAGQQLHGRPDVSVGQLIVLAAVIAFAVWGLWRILGGRHGWFTLFAVAAVALWQGVALVGVLVHGFVLVALPAFAARAAVVTCLACGVALLPIVFRLAELPERARGGGTHAREELDFDAEPAQEWER